MSRKRSKIKRYRSTAKTRGALNRWQVRGAIKAMKSLRKRRRR